jgi:hypothetical protein
MPPCPSYPPCTLSRSSVDANTVLNEVASVDASTIAIVGEKGEILVEYDRHETVVEATKESPAHILHYFTPTDASSSRLDNYKGSKIIIQLNNDEGSEPLEITLKLRR